MFLRSSEFVARGLGVGRQHARVNNDDRTSTMLNFLNASCTAQSSAITLHRYCMMLHCDVAAMSFCSLCHVNVAQRAANIIVWLPPSQFSVMLDYFILGNVLQSNPRFYTILSYSLQYLTFSSLFYCGTAHSSLCVCFSRVYSALWAFGKPNYYIIFKQVGYYHLWIPYFLVHLCNFF